MATKKDYVVGSGNVFADLGYARPEEAAAKAELAHKITKIIERRKLTQAEAANVLEIDQPNVAVVNWKLAEDGQGTILRLQEFAGRDTKASLRFVRNTIKSAKLANGVEEDLEPLSTDGHSLSLTFRRYEVLTVRVQ